MTFEGGDDWLFGIVLEGASVGEDDPADIGEVAVSSLELVWSIQENKFRKDVIQ